MNRPQDHSFSNLCNSGEYSRFVSADRDSNRKGDDEDDSHKNVDIIRKTDDFKAIPDHDKRLENAVAFSSSYANFDFHNKMKLPLYHLPPLDMSLTPLPLSSSSDLKWPALKKPPATAAATSLQFGGDPASTAMLGSSSRFASTDWLPLKTLGEHVELDDYHIFDDDVIDFKHDSTSCQGTSSTKTNETPSKISVLADFEKLPSSQEVVGSQEPGTASSLSPDCPKSTGEISTDTSKVYVEDIKANDVLFGQGGKSNLHPGNIRYREEVANYQELYKSATDVKEKQGFNRHVTNFVKNVCHGRFLLKDSATNSWYVAPDKNVWKKVSQCLRENNNKEHRKAKRARHIEKKKKLHK